MGERVESRGEDEMMYRRLEGSGPFDLLPSKARTPTSLPEAPKARAENGDASQEFFDWLTLLRN